MVTKTFFILWPFKLFSLNTRPDLAMAIYYLFYQKHPVNIYLHNDTVAVKHEKYTNIYYNVDFTSITQLHQLK